MVKKSIKGTSGIEPETSRSAVECSTTELYPLVKWIRINIGVVIEFYFKNSKKKRVQYRFLLLLNDSDEWFKEISMVEKINMFFNDDVKI